MAHKQFNLTISKNDPNQRVPVVKAIREATGCGLREAVDLYNAGGGPVSLWVDENGQTPFAFRDLWAHISLSSGDNVGETVSVDELLRKAAAQVLATGDHQRAIAILQLIG